MILTNSIYFSLYLKFPQLKVLKAIKKIKEKENNKISSKDTLIMALSSKIGVGSLAGTALAINYGGLGTIFWMIISTFFLSILTYIENGLSIIYKNKNNQENRGGPFYYINNKKLSKIYAVIALISYSILFSSIQNNTITTLTKNTYNINITIVSIFITVLSAIIIAKGIKTISNICNKLFPVMMLFFILIGITIIIKNIQLIPSLIYKIIVSAFTNDSFKGGIIYTIIITFQKTIFANESGVGTSAIISGATENNDYKKQAQIGLIQTYFINFIVILITALIISLASPKGLIIKNGIELTKYAFSYHMSTFGEFSLFVILILFSFSTLITIYYYGEISLKFLTENKQIIKILKLFTILSIFIGGIIKAPIIWNFIDINLALLTIINMCALYSKKREIILKLK